MIEQEQPTNRAPRRSLSLVMLELDRFEQLERTHGRGTGDRALCQVVKIVRGHARPTDAVVRYYSDQLAIVLPDRGPTSVERLAEAIRVAIERHRFEPGGLRVTASLGVADLALYFSSGNTLIDEANARLRRASRLGGNQVVSWDDDMCMFIRHRPLPMARPSPSPCLVVLHGAGLGLRYELSGRTLTIGRSASSDIRIVDDSVSRTHATITADARGVRIHDEGARNGILVNGVRTRECLLQYGDVVHVGRTIFALASLDPGTSNVEAFDQIARVRSPSELVGLDLTASPDAETEAMELDASEPLLAPP